MVTGGVSRPRDGWVAAYMPEKLVLMRAGNADASPMLANAYGGTIHAEPLKKFLKWLLDNHYISNVDMKEEEISKVVISKLTGKTVNGNIP
ncbi:hypothetical protein IJM86_03080 [bacterium]|nr:hypothetical protein [bacterium]